MSAAGKALSKALDSPEDWTSDGKYTITHRPTGLVFWIANGAWFFDGYRSENTPQCLGLIERHWLYFKARHIIPQRRKENGSATVAAKFAEVNR